MSKHSSSLHLVPSPILESRSNSLQPTPRERLAALAALGLAKCSAKSVARNTGRSLATVYGWRHPATVGGFCGLDLLQAPPSFARVVVRGLAVAVDGAPPPDGPSRSSLAAVLARVAGLLLAIEHEDPSKLSDEALDERVQSLNEAEQALRQRRQPYDVETLRRRLERQQKG